MGGVGDGVMGGCLSTVHHLSYESVYLYGGVIHSYSYLHPSFRDLFTRLYDVYKKAGEVKDFGQMLHNIFAPLFAVSLNP
ncbi:hypothetical protein EON65_56040, partial [archaeon]